MADESDESHQIRTVRTKRGEVSISLQTRLKQHKDPCPYILNEPPNPCFQAVSRWVFGPSCSRTPPSHQMHTAGEPLSGTISFSLPNHAQPHGRSCRDEHQPRGVRESQNGQGRTIWYPEMVFRDHQGSGSSTKHCTCPDSILHRGSAHTWVNDMSLTVDVHQSCWIPCRSLVLVLVWTMPR